VSVRVGFDQSVCAGIVHRRQDDSRLGSPFTVQAEDGAKIHLRQHITVEHDNGVGQGVAGVSDRAASAERHRLDDVAKSNAEAGSLAEDLLNAAWLVVEAEDHLVDFRNLLQEIYLVIQEWSIKDRNDRLRRVNREWAEPRALPACEKNGLHATSDHNADCGL
jgi:hypothetical protein